MSEDEKQQTLSRLFAGRFEVLDPLPWNGLALVHAARGMLHRDLALAVLPLDCESNPEHSRLFHQSFERLRSLEDARSLRIHDIGVQRGVPFVAWERETGVVLSELLGAPMAPERAEEIVAQLIDALEPLHGAGLHHGDLTPRNVLVRPEGVSLIGLGVAPLLRRLGPDVTGPTGRGSGPKARRYLAPEVLDGRLTGADAPGPATDIYALGALLHVLASGEVPGGDVSPDARKRLAPHPALRLAIARAMDPDPSARPPLEELRTILGRGDVGPRPLPPAVAPSAEAVPALPEAPPPEASASEASASESTPEAAASKSASVSLAPSPAPPKRSGGALAGLLALGVLLAAGAAVFALTRSPQRAPVPADPTATPVGDAPEPVAAEPAAAEPAAEGEAVDDAAEPEAATAGEDTAAMIDEDSTAGPLAGVDDPFLVDELQRIEERGDRYDQEDFRRIYGWISRNPGDVRGHLVLGRAYARRGWHRAAVEGYGEALTVDSEAARRDPQILEHLVAASIDGSEPVAEMAWPFLRRHWGARAVRGLAPFDGQPLPPARQRAVDALRRRLERLDP